MKFEDLKKDYYGRYACGPGIPRTERAEPSDIVLHLPVLEYYASLCETVTEFGVREGHSTVAFISGRPGRVSSFDIDPCPIANELAKMDLPCQFSFELLNTIDESQAYRVGDTDLLFLDTLHTYDHLSKELKLHGRKARRYLAFHDTSTCGERDRSGPNPDARGIMPAIKEFLAQYPGEYNTAYKTDACNGLWILERVPPNEPCLSPCCRE